MVKSTSRSHLKHFPSGPTCLLQCMQVNPCSDMRLKTIRRRLSFLHLQYLQLETFSSSIWCGKEWTHLARGETVSQLSRGHLVLSMSHSDNSAYLDSSLHVGQTKKIFRALLFRSFAIAILVLLSNSDLAFFATVSALSKWQKLQLSFLETLFYSRIV